MKELYPNADEQTQMLFKANELMEKGDIESFEKGINMYMKWIGL